MSEKFETIKIDKTVCLQKDGIEFSAYIAGVNSGMYQLPFVIVVRTWASKWGFKKFFWRELKLNINEVKMLHKELGKVIEYTSKKL